MDDWIAANWRSNGLKVPEDFQIIGCDNFELTDSAAPRISTVDPGFTEIGRRAGEWAMADHFENPRLATEQFTAEPRLILKESSFSAKS
jgi:DNA-binding LacI/PurR family transcriptional regulator